MLQLVSPHISFRNTTFSRARRRNAKTTKLTRRTETDQIFPAPKRHETEAILEKLPVPYQINLFSDVVHGFAVRCDLSKRREKFAKEQAFLQAVAWFDEHLKSA